MAEVVIVRNAGEAGEIAADEIENLVRRKPNAVLGLATGSTPLTTWESLAQRGIDLSQVRGFALDEYVGLDPEHPESYRSVIDREVVGPLGLTPELIRVPRGSAPLESAGEEYERAILDAGGVDLQLLGIGRTGHLGFNEPGSSLASLTRVKTLTEQTRRDNARFFPSVEHVPTLCITQGLGTILRARQLLILAFGEAKSKVVANAVEGPVTSSLPGSVLQLHPRTIVIVDEAAASGLANADYYRRSWKNRVALANGEFRGHIVS